jgi:hypothetical protein
MELLHEEAAAVVEAERAMDEFAVMAASDSDAESLHSDGSQENNEIALYVAGLPQAPAAAECGELSEGGAEDDAEASNDDVCARGIRYRNAATAVRTET